MSKDVYGYKKTKWSGLPNYECSDCPWSSLDEKEMQLHRAFDHNDPTAALEASAEESKEEQPELKEKAS